MALSVCLFVCLFVCLSVPSNLRGLNSYDNEIWHVGAPSDQKTLRSIRILIFGLGPFLGPKPVFRNFLFVQRLRVGLSSNLKSWISGSIPNM